MHHDCWIMVVCWLGAWRLWILVTVEVGRSIQAEGAACTKAVYTWWPGRICRGAVWLGGAGMGRRHHASGRAHGCGRMWEPWRILSRGESQVG